MKIELKGITVRELTKGFQDNAEGGVIGYGGKLDIRPPYQREFIYKDKQRDAVINTIQNEFPLNVMYWAVRDDGNFEVIDGQQRTISVCQYVNGDFSFKNLYFHNLPDDRQNQIRNYKLTVYLCSGTDSERLDWFRTINIAGEKLTDQELRNAVYAGPWTADAKRYFSKTGCPAFAIGGDYVTGIPIRQEFLEAAIDWISEGEIEKYMATHQHDQNANELWLYYKRVIDWIGATFKTKRKFMKTVAWGKLYNEFHDKPVNTKKIEDETGKLIADDDVQKKSGIYPYILTRDEKYLGIRQFTDSTKQKVYEKQQGICVKCLKHFDIFEMEGDHIKPWREGGKTVQENCQMLCKDDNRRKAGA